ncbi:uracil-DNA glycosylase [Halovulum sp. GXIMD14794]
MNHPETFAESLAPEDALAALIWQIELGADEAILDAPVNRYEQPAVAPAPKAAAVVAAPAPKASAADEAEKLAAAAADLPALHAAIAAFEGCALKRGARNTVFADGVPGARVMIVGEAPGREEDQQGKPFVGKSGQLLDRMFAAIGLSRTAGDPAEGLYITNTVPWRPPQNRDPSPEEMSTMLPFLRRHIALAAPEILVVMGAPAARTVLQTTSGITRLRGQWQEALGLPVLPMNHPAALLRDPLKKRLAWSDLLTLKARLA